MLRGSAARPSGTPPTARPPRSHSSRRAVRRAGTGGLAALIALGTVPAITGLSTVANAAVTVGSNISVFPDRDMVGAMGYEVGEQLLIEVLRNGVVVGTTQGAAMETDEGPGIEVNHGPEGTPLPGECWNGFTPDIIGGDLVRVTALDRPGAPQDTMTVKDLVFTGDPF